MIANCVLIECRRIVWLLVTTRGGFIWSILQLLILPHIYFGVPEVKGKEVQGGGISLKLRYKMGLITILGKSKTIVNCRVPMADVHFRVPYGLMSPH